MNAYTVLKEGRAATFRAHVFSARMPIEVLSFVFGVSSDIFFRGRLYHSVEIYLIVVL